MTLFIYLKNFSSMDNGNICTAIFVVALFTVIKRQDHPKMYINRWTCKENVYMHNEILLSYNNEIITFSKNKNATGHHYVKRCMYEYIMCMCVWCLCAWVWCVCTSGVCMHVYVYIYACIYTCVSVYLCVFLNVYICVSVSVDVCVYVCVCLLACLCLFVYVSLYICVCVCVCWCVPVHTCVSVCCISVSVQN